MKTSDSIKHIAEALVAAQKEIRFAIKDLYDAEIKSIAKFIAENYETNTFAKWAYEDTIAHVI